MIKNYLKTALRNLRRHKSFSLLNIAGLSIGMAASILILLWVQHEKSYDRFHAHAGQLYRIASIASEDFQAAVNPAAMPAGLQAKIPFIKNTVRLSHPSTNVFEYNDSRFEEKNGFYVDSTFFDVFSFPLAAGSANTVLQRPDAILITEDMAKKYFGNADPIGKTLRKNNSEWVTVTGVLKNLPSNSHLQFDYIMPMAAIAHTHNDLINNAWGNFNFYSYLLLDESFHPSAANLKQFEAQINAIYKANASPTKITFRLQPITDIHLHSHLQVELPGNGNVQYVNILFVVAIFILAIACINFMNLSTARSARRAREVGLRKVVGAARWQLITQFLGEAIVIACCSLLIAITLVWLTLPLFNQLAGKALEISFDGKLWFLLIGIALATGLVAGSYPALFLSGFQPIKVLKGKLRLGGSANLLFRNVLVILQFVVSIVLIVGTIVVYNQLEYIKKRNVGFEKSNLVYVPIKGDLASKPDAYRNELSRLSLTADFTIIDDVPTNLTTGIMDVQWEGRDPESSIVIPTLDIDENFVDVFQVEMAAGRAFSREFSGDSSNFIINEKLASIMGLDAETAVGKPLTIWGQQGMIIGVTKDFNFKPIQQAVEPIIMEFNRWPWDGKAVVRTKPGATEATIKALENIHAKLDPTYPFSYHFLDQDLENLYRGEQRLGSLFNLFAGLAIFISCLGLYGLSAFIAEQRVKEIGIRKVLGASVGSVVQLLSRNFVGLVMIAIVIAIPVAWYMMNSWLTSFAYRIDIGWPVFLLAATIAVAIALLTVSYESIKAAIANPVESLRNE